MTTRSIPKSSQLQHQQHQQHLLEYEKSPQSLLKKKKGPLSLIKTTMVLSGIFCVLIMSIQLHVHSDLHSKHTSLRYFNDNDDDGISGMVDLNSQDDHYDININDATNGGDQNQQNANENNKNGHENGNGNGNVDGTNSPDTNSPDTNIDSANDMNKVQVPQEVIKPIEKIMSKTTDNSKRNSNSNNNSTNINCGCPATCTNDALEISNSNFNCRTRIRKLMSKYKFTEQQACSVASKASIDDADEEGTRPCPLYCNPNVCHTMDESTIQQLHNEETKEKDIDCGCPETCTKRALQKRNPNFLCLDRIQHLMTKYNIPEEEACEAASQTEFIYTKEDMKQVDMNLNKPCEYECHPKLCKSTKVPDDEIATLDLPKSFIATTTNATTTSRTASTIQSSFHKYDKVVIVTKVLSAENIDILVQMLCLFHTAYNRFVNYDIIVFTTIPFTEEEIQIVRDVVAPHTRLEVVPEGPSLEDHLGNMTQSEIKSLYERCNVLPNETSITWHHHCSEENSEHVFNLGYAWQAEFRSYHLWTHPALEEYKYMMWLDADAMCTKTWENDPMRVMIENDLVLMFDQFPGGYVSGEVLRQKIEAAYGNGSSSNYDGGGDGSGGGGSNSTAGVICMIDLDMERGVLTREFCTDDGGRRSLPSIRQVYGFHHITNLDIYRKEKHQRFLKGLITNDYKFSRLWDDQLAVTLPAVMEDPERCWDYRLNGLHVGIHHNGRIDGKEHPEYLSYLNFWAHHGKYDWPAARAMCDGLVTSIG